MAFVDESAEISGGSRITYVSDAMTTAGPVITNDPLEWTYSIPQFAPSRGELTSASVTFYGSIATSSVVVAFADVDGGPTFEEATLEVVAGNSTFFFGQTALIVNGTGDLGPVALGNLDAAEGDGTFEIYSAYAGAFFASPYGTLPQQGFLGGVEVEYTFTPSAGSRFGTDENDTITGTSGTNWIESGAGNDRVSAGSGSDVVLLGDGNDYVRVGGGKESFFGGDGKDYISYYDSANGVTVNLATDAVSGSWASNDIISDFESVSGSRTGADKITGTSGANTIKTYGGNDKVYAGGGSDKVELGSGNDYVRVGGGKETFDGGSGTDYISYYDSANGIRIDLRDDEVSGSWAVNDTIKDFESAAGSRTGDDVMLGTNGANTLRGYGGDDNLYGRSGADKLYGGAGQDFMDGGGGAGTDLLYGGADADIFHFDRGEGVDLRTIWTLSRPVV